MNTYTLTLDSPRNHTSLALTISPETLEDIEFNRIFTCHPLHSVV